ncbi:unnamed protein product [Paramecium primaurelia]|uniref:Transmembrane protein n=1 Tax=Paramecium primaurelia TaxID=5886 RepID=A0A8S1QET8_PARPR|nr:unnamed protein product [Paramecium primaurelia]
MGMIIWKLFISYLSYIYCVYQFENGKQFLHCLIDILNEDQQNFEKIFNQLLKETVYVHLIIQVNQDQQIKSVYQGNDNHTEYSKFHRIDTCLTQLDIFLFDVKCILKCQKYDGRVLLNLKWYNTLRINKLEVSKLLIMVYQFSLNNYDLYNVCCPLLIQLTSELKLSLVTINMEIFRKNFGVLITSNFSNHILSICEVDQTSKNQNSKEYIKYSMNLVQYRINHNCKLKLKKNCLSKKNQIVKYDQEIRLHERVLMQQLLKIY